MSDNEIKTPNKTGASGAAWSEGEKIAYLIILCENEGKIDAKINNAPIPAGRSTTSCKKLLVRLKERHKDDIARIKNGQAFAPAATTAATDASPEKPKAKATHRKRKSKADVEAGAGNGSEDGKGEEGVMEGSPNKKATPRGRKKKVEVKAEVKEEEGLVEEEMLDEEMV
ncbi:hypothetical protein BKA58DRAFT_442784 [Alternaria rosae]|uniref:uncharacterized protein n=1 Tax=Alternaria rosae TaxID=1187941 RepID=UPI001E8CC531|nr:uncharacterized protein BKA58DRAFT_442784 [Alternaria rosae]KAH6864709.1 hypothetical protein BKA58DRAFT_442784 [Alternaria rosae]